VDLKSPPSKVCAVKKGSGRQGVRSPNFNKSLPLLGKNGGLLVLIIVRGKKRRNKRRANKKRGDKKMKDNKRGDKKMKDNKRGDKKRYL
jgi:hypothetical protein